MATRQPRDTSKGLNGFRDRHGVPSAHSPDELAVSRRSVAEYILAAKGSRPFSSLQDLIATPLAPPQDTPETVANRVKELKQQHQEDIERLSAFVAEQYRHVLRDRYASVDPATTGVDAEDEIQVDYLAALDELCRDARPMRCFQHDVEDALSQLRYIYLKSLLPLLAQRRALKLQDAQARRKRDAQFPQTIEQYHDIAERDIQLRVARFLTLSDPEQEKMREDYGWPWMAVLPLVSLYKQNTSFKKEILEAVKDVRASDPRRRPPAAATPGWQA